MQPALAQICSLKSPFELDVTEYAAAHCEALEVWWTKLEEYLKHHSLDDVRRLMTDNQISITAAAQQGGLLASQGDARREAWTLFQTRLQLARQLGIKTLIVACDVPAPLDQQLLDRTCVSLQQAAAAAEQHGLRLALEFQARAAFGSNLRTAAWLVAETGNRALGLCFDAFHYYAGPSKSEDLLLLSPENLFHVQLSDVADVPRELAADSHRILPGEGDIGLQPVVDRLRAIDYQGSVSVELMNPVIWQIPPRQFGEIAITALRRLLGLASMD